jgi:type IV pilus assembly protein PilY1
LGNQVIFGSLIPGSSSVAACAASGGGGNVYAVDIAGGSGTFTASQVGILGEPLVAEISSATTYGSTDSTGRRIKTVINQVFQQGGGDGGSNRGGIAAGTTATRQVVTGRMSWRQINNYQNLHSP